MEQKEYKCPVCNSPLVIKRAEMNGNYNNEKPLNVNEWEIKLTCVEEPCGFSLTLGHKKEPV